MRKHLNNPGFIFILLLFFLSTISISYAGLHDNIKIVGSIQSSSDFNELHQVGYFPFDEMNEDSTPDKSLYKNDGLLLPSADIGPFLDSNGRKNNCFFFDGFNDFIEISNQDQLCLSDSFTLMAWIKPMAVTSSDWTEDHTILAKKYSYYVSIDPLGNLSFYGYGLSAGWIHSINLEPYLHKWTHIAITYDGSHITVYIDGIENLYMPVTGVLDTTSTPLTIGYVGYDRYFEGFIDEIKIYDISLTFEDIQYHYNFL